ncbi:MAG TPA: DUF4465 domain-containing protein [Paludibacteraceae bacterium]|nr:DUF4465 domain-containing protein [Paludibacteraceae bacterium]HNZ61488.1 DUF4465 domain-containing protein [Paludibacteraceae bacterium]
MKKKSLILLPAFLLIFFTACENESDSTLTTTVDFEDVELGENGYWNGADSSGKFISNGFSFLNEFTSSSWGDYWSGFACSSLTDTITAGYDNQYSVAAGSGAWSSKKFAIAFDDSATVMCPKNELGNYTVKSIMFCNSTYAYLDMRNGSAFSKKFENGDWFKVTVKGFLDNNVTGAVDYYLADFRNGKSYLTNQWVKVDLSSLGKVDNLIFLFDSSDKGTFGVNTPKYVCIDNLEFEQDAEK